MGASESRNSSEFTEDLAEVFCFMGQTSSTGQPKGKKVVAAKLESASKTGVLNLADLDLKPNSSVWLKLNVDGLNVKIKTLDISGNSLKAMPVEIFSLSNVKTMHASRCGIQRIANMSALDKLQQLDLSHNDLEIDVLIALPISLTILNLSANHFSAIPPAIVALVSLVELDLSGNRIESTTGLGSLVSLVSLKLDGNLLCELSEDMGGMAKLRTISLRHNRIQKKAFSRDGQSIPASFFTGTAVDTIILSENVGLKKADVLDFAGVDAFLQRRKKVKDKSFQGGAMTDMDLFGIE